MAADPNAVEQAVSRTLRDNLGRIQRTSEELNQAINDLVSACASSRATNALPPMVRAQTSAASLAAALEVLSRLVTSALQPSMRSPFEQEIQRLTSAVAVEAPPAIQPPEPMLPKPMGESPWRSRFHPSYHGLICRHPFKHHAVNRSRFLCTNRYRRWSR
jgi:hypothetical protein